MPADDGDEHQSLLSIGSRDLAVWSLRRTAGDCQLKFSRHVGHSLDFAAISTGRKALVCGSADCGAVTTVSLTAGGVDHVARGPEYRGMTDLVVSESEDGRVFVATPTSGVVVLCVGGNEVKGQDEVKGCLCDPSDPSLVPTRLLLSGESQLVVGYSHGLILVFGLATRSVVCSLQGSCFSSVYFLYSQTGLCGQHWDLMMSIHFRQTVHLSVYYTLCCV